MAESGTRPSGVRLGELAHARSGDKGSSANIGVAPYTTAGFQFLKNALTADLVERYFSPLGVGKVVRYELPGLEAFNFVLPGILAGGGSRSLRVDAQGKALGQALLELVLFSDPPPQPDCFPSPGDLE